MTEDDIPPWLEARLGPQRARERLAVEREHEAQAFGQGLNFFHIENVAYSPRVIRAALTVVGLYRRGLANAEKIALRENLVVSSRLPAAFDGFTILHLSDLHVDMCPGAMARVGALLQGLRYDLCVLTGDYRGATTGPFAPALAGLARLRAAIDAPILAVLGNHDTIRMAPGLEAMAMTVLLNEREAIERGGARIHVAGVDEPHYFRADDLGRALAGAPREDFSILLSHTPEIYARAAGAGVDLLLAGHTHGGQICLPGGTPVTLDSVLPRALGAGAWRHGEMQGYTSVGAGSSVLPVRFNCPPEITLHRLRKAS
ncbi:MULTISPECIES: metallophosphoesterase [Methylosinus]|uniref:Metallophosphoesterase n=1 Tax=Methylosinus trichosporium (strain ATCC 35070 / NCIMB 11131 / UNIQEM 75 / OB3b) TaxID=595536 RepID=A0A2D2D169_METT3|nr:MULTISPECIES: metallophosphoesterase [Methylosinus]ATQ68737.1 metallophosphoesterase [Methylosinus trichosporium OB3b]OBS53104.1 metallophosphoesterase [Methylosinus sp. 3S-1]